MTLPTITWGGQEFWNIEGIVSPNRYTRMGTDGAAIHHSVAQQYFPDFDSKVAHVIATNKYHLDKGYGGYGYNAIAFEDGTVMTVGNASGGRAHVANQNGHLAGIEMAGDFSEEPVPIGIQLGVGRFLAAMQKEYGVTEVRGHRDWVAQQDKPQWATACPGDSGESFIGKMVMVRDALLAGSTAAIAKEVQRKIAEAIVPNAQTADLDALAGQIRYLTGGRLCL
jgi:hypothetical protein